MDYQYITYEQFDNVVRICHNRPEKSNAQTLALLKELDHAVMRAGSDNAVRVVILGGKGKHFSAGHDLTDAFSSAESGEYDMSPESWEAFENEFYMDYSMHIYDLPKPTIAQVQGACVGGAFMVANMCDLLVASEDAFFADPVIHMNATAGAEVMVAPYVLGFRKAKEMLFTGDRISAQEGYMAGMVNRIVPRDRLEEEVLAMARKIAKAPPFAMKMTKKSLNRMLDMQGFRPALQAHHHTHLLAHQSAETKKMYAALNAGDPVKVAKDKQK
jgi:enoyl-CoA hydratase